MKKKIDYISRVSFFLAFLAAFAACIEDTNGPTDDVKVPVIDKISATPNAILVNDSSVISVEARDLNGETLNYVWKVLDGGTLSGNVASQTVTWHAPSVQGVYRIRCRVSNKSQKFTADTVRVSVQTNVKPVINVIYPQPNSYISAGLGQIYINFSSVPQNQVDTIKCFINNQLYQTVNFPPLNYNISWNISELNGSQEIKLVAKTDYFSPGIWQTDSVIVPVSIEGGIGKRK